MYILSSSTGPLEASEEKLAPTNYRSALVSVAVRPLADRYVAYRMIYCPLVFNISRLGEFAGGNFITSMKMNMIAEKPVSRTNLSVTL